MLPKRKKIKFNKTSKIIMSHEKVRHNFIWTTRQGKNIILSKMDTNHLKNAIAKIKRGDYKSREMCLNDLVTELLYREVHSIKNIKKSNTNGKRSKEFI